VQQISVVLGSTLAPLGSQTDEGMTLFGVSDGMPITSVVASEKYAQLRVGATDAYGNVFYAPTSAKAVFSVPTGTTSAADAGTLSLEVALENIRNYRVQNVRITTDAAPNYAAGAAFVSGGAASKLLLQKRYLVTFVPDERNSANYGLQNPLVCDTGYSCSQAGCAPIVNMPFLTRYASFPEYPSWDSTLNQIKTGTPTPLSFYTFNTDANFKTARNFVRLAPNASPQMPLGMSVDSEVVDETTRIASPYHYDIRIVIACQDPPNSNNAPSDVDVYWTKVTYGNTNISTDTTEYTSGLSATGVWSALASTASAFQPTLLVFTYRGFIPSDLKTNIPDAPGVIIEFPSKNMVDTNMNFRFYEILIKLPACIVTPLVTGTEFKDVTGGAISPVDPKVENEECSNRGQCNRATGLCECFSGFYGISCSRQTTMV